MRELYTLLPALAYGNKSVEGKTQLNVNLGPLQRKLISPPAANYCHEIKWFVLFGECQLFNGKRRRGGGAKEEGKKTHYTVTAGICLQDYFTSAKRKAGWFTPQGSTELSLVKGSLLGGESLLLPAEGLPKGAQR